MVDWTDGRWFFPVFDVNIRGRDNVEVVFIDGDEPRMRKSRNELSRVEAWDDDDDDEITMCLAVPG